jgi:hypothetical protein
MAIADGPVNPQSKEFVFLGHGLGGLIIKEVRPIP